MIIVLDTSFLLLPGLQRVDVFLILKQAFPNAELCTTQSVVKELSKIAMGNTKKSRAARIALTLIKQKNLKILASPKALTVDDSLIAVKPDVLATLDEELVKKALKNGVKTLQLHKNKVVLKP
ncbi:hypothetical protein J7L02_03685 [Candidatus Woesearchaeota archaeon]|nr:hypothetical protein [Candidatus Woesearchaeota archaeon]